MPVLQGWITPRPCLIILVVAAANCCTTAFAQVNYVITISVDGLRPDAITALGPSQAPNFYRLRNEGAFTDNARTDYDYTITLPNHTSMLTGRRVNTSAGHNWTNNVDPPVEQNLHNNKGSYVSSAYDVVHDNGLRTALYSGKTKFVLYSQSYNSFNGGLDTIGTDNGRKKIDRSIINFDSDALTDSFITGMEALPYHFSMLHYKEPDEAGHGNSWDVVNLNSPYLNSVRKVDGYLGKVLQSVDTHPLLKNHTAIVLTADHGGIQGTNDHGTNSNAQAYTIPFYVWGPGIPAGADLYAMNATTRLNPGSGRPDYSATIQPIRNGELANLSLDLLGLNSVPGSTINSLQNLTVLNPYPPGDYNYDGEVDDDDFALWRSQYGTNAKRASDGTGDNIVSATDYVFWRIYAGNSNGGAATMNVTTSAVPEPSSVAFALVALTAATTMRLRKRRARTSPPRSGEGAGEGRALFTSIAILVLAILAAPAPAASYSGNGGTSFGGVLRNGTLTIEDTPTGTINFTFMPGGSFSRNIVIYIDSKPGGYPNNYLMDYTPGSDNQRAASGFNETTKVHSLIQFAPGFEADYVLPFWVRANTAGAPSGSLRTLADGTGADAGRVVLTTTVPANISGAQTMPPTPVTFNFNAADIGLTPGAGQEFRFIATYLNGSNGVRSNEFIGGVAKSYNYDGNGNLASVTMSDWRTYTLLAAGAAADHSPPGDTVITPEPASLLLASLTLIGCISRRPRRRHS